MAPELIPVLLVALITWGGVLLYLVRLTAQIRTIERDVAALGEIDNSTP